jgi:uncharacterized Tic20 family protein
MLPTRTADIAAYFADSLDGVAIAVPPGAFRSRGLRVGLGVPLLCVILGGYMAAALEMGWLAVAVAGTLAALGAAWGAWIAAGAEAASAATRIRLGSDGTLILADGRTLPRGTVRTLRITPPSGAKLTITGDTDSGPVEILGNIPVTDGARAKPVAEWLAAAIGAEADTRAAPNAFGWSPNNVAMLCYMPVQGIWLVASILALATSSDPFVRFAGKQALAYYVATGVALVAAIVGIVGVTLAIDNEAVLALGLFAMGGLMLVRLGIGVYAGWQAYHGKTWVIPGFGWLGAPPAIDGPRVADPPAGAWQPPAHQG